MLEWTFNIRTIAFKIPLYLCVPEEDIPVANDETADKVLEKVKHNLKETCPNISGSAIDQTHCIGNNHKCFKANNTCRSVIVPFNSVKH